MTGACDLPPGVDRAVLEALDESVVVTDTDIDPPGPRIIYANPAFERLTGWNRREIIGRHPRFLQGPDTDRAVLDELRAALQSGTHFAGETFNYRRDGSRFRMHWRIMPVRDGAGRITHFVSAQQDVSADYENRRSLEMNEARFRSLTEDVLDISNVGLFILDRDLRIVWLNQSVERFFGIQRDALMGKQAPTCVPGAILSAIEDGERFRVHLARSYESPSYEERFECHVLPSEDRHERWLEHWNQPIRTGLYAGGRVEHFADVSERHRTAEKLCLQTRELEHAARLTLAGQMAAAMVHELAQPLSAATNFIEIALRGCAAGVPANESTLEALRDAQAATIRAGTIARHMLDFSRKQGAGSQRVDLCALADVAIRIKTPDARAHRIRIEKSITNQPLMIEADPIEIEQVLYNLIQNSIRAIERADASSRVVHVTVHGEDDKAIVEVSDTGPGVPPALRDRLFDAFQSDERSEGLGLGLWICWNIMERSGGTIELIDPEPGRTTFRMTVGKITISG